MRTEHLGPDEILVAAKIEYDSKLTFDDLVADASTSPRPTSAPWCRRLG